MISLSDYLRLFLAVAGCFGPFHLSRAADTNAVPDAASSLALTNTVRTEVSAEDYFEVRNQLEAMQRASDDARDQTEAVTRQNAALADRMATLEKMLVAQKEREFELIRGANRFGLTILAASMGAALLAILVSIWFQSRCVNRMLEIATRFPALHGPEPALLENGTGSASARLLGAMKLLEERVNKMEKLGASVVENFSVSSTSPVSGVSGAESGQGASLVGGSPGNSDSLLIAKGQALLDMDRPQEALSCFEETLAHDPGCAEAHLKKGVALERSKRLDQSLASYEEALHLNPSLTVAYLYKGRVLQELERYEEALACYDRALTRSPKSHVEVLAV